MTQRDGDATRSMMARLVLRRDDARTRDAPSSGGAWARRSGVSVATQTERDAAPIARPAPEQHALLRLQRQYGNRYVQRVVDVARSAEREGAVSGDVEAAIASTRGSGHSLDRAVQTQMGDALGADFSNVRVHSNAQADGLNRALHARAFTVGQDVYFRHGEYAPGSSTGRELLAHELTHVVQQSAGGVQPKADDDGSAGGCGCGAAAVPGVQMQLSVSQPGDRYEQEADRIATAVMHQEQRGAGPSPETASIHRQVPEEDEDKMQAKYRDDAPVQGIEERDGHG